MRCAIGLPRECQFHRGAGQLAFLQRGIEQLPARDELLHDALQACDVERPRRSGDAWDRAGIQGRRDSVFIAFEQTKIDAVGTLIIIVIDVDARSIVVIPFENASSDHLFDDAERGNSRCIRQALNRGDPVLFQDPLHSGWCSPHRTKAGECP